MRAEVISVIFCDCFAFIFLYALKSHLNSPTFERCRVPIYIFDQAIIFVFFSINFWNVNTLQLWMTKTACVISIMKLVVFALILTFLPSFELKFNFRLKSVQCGFSPKTIEKQYCFVRAYKRTNPLMNYGHTLKRKIPNGKVWIIKINCSVKSNKIVYCVR
jgi:hypothetical protein